MKQQPAPRVAGYCALCRSRCGAQFVVEDGRLTGVEPLADHPTGGALCAKGRAGPELQYHPARLTKPLRRTRPRSDPDPGWVEVSWDEALGDIAARLGAIRAESGAHAIAFASASPGATALSDSLEWIERLVFAFGSPNFLTGVEICNWHRDHNHAFTFGTGIGMPDYANSDLVMLWGFNPGNVWLAQAQGVAAAQARGAKLLVIDPVRTRHARQADLWLPVRPGTDAALALGLARELIAQGRHDDDFVRRWTNAPFLIREDDGRPLTERDLLPQAAGNADGFGERERPLAWHLERGAPVALDTSEAMAPSLSMQLALAGHFVVETAAGPVACRPAMAHYMAACEPWTPQAVEAFTGVPAAQVREAARMIGDAGQRISYFSWTGIAQHANATQTDRAIALLYAITGSVDAPGGNLHLARAAAAKINDRTLLDPAQAERALGLAQRPLGPPAHGWTLGTDFHRAVVEGEPYRVRALVGFGANLLMSQPDSQAIRAALQGLEFQVHCDLFETPTARHADYLLPVQTPYEREGLRIGFEISAAAQHTVQLRPAVVAPTPGSEARADLDIVFDLAVRLGHGDLFFGGDVERGWNHALAPLGLTAAALRAQPQGMVRLPFLQRSRQYAEPSVDGDMRKVRGFATPSRRIEIHASRFAAHGIPPVPEVVAPRARFDIGEQASAFNEAWPLTLCCAKSGYYCQSQHRGLSTLRAREPEPQARLHPALADARGIAPGDAFEVRTAHGAARFRAVLDDDLAPDVVMASFGWWQACEDLGIGPIDPLGLDHSNMNALVDAAVADGPSGSVPLRSYPCDVRAVAGVRRWRGWKTLALRRLSHPAEGVIEFELTSPDGAPLPDHRPGQHVRLAFDLPGLARTERFYSLTHGAGGVGLSGAADDAGHSAWRIAVRRGAELSDALHRHFDAQPDAVLTVLAQPPDGRFLLPIAPARPTVLIATGIGITPFLSMLETMAAARPSTSTSQPMLLLYGNRDASQHAFASRLAELAHALPALTIIDRYSRSPASDDGNTEYIERIGRIDVHDIGDEWFQADARFYLCGSPAMLRAFRDGLRARGVPPFAIFSESFEAASPPPSSGGRFDIHFLRSGRRATWDGSDRSLLAMADRLGIPAAGGCRVGQCESCRVGVRAGQVHHFSDTAVADEGDCLACIAVPASHLEIDL